MTHVPGRDASIGRPNAANIAVVGGGIAGLGAAWLLTPKDDVRVFERALDAVVKKAGLKAPTVNFLALVAQNRRLFAVRDMIKAFFVLLAQHRGEVTANVASASKLSAAQEKSLKTALKSAIGQDVQIDTTVDPELLGGLVVKVGSRMIDTSLRTKLNNMKFAMKEVG